MKPRLFIIIAVVAALVGLWQLAGNARQSAAMRDKIITKDQAGSDVKTDIQSLIIYVHNHMHASAKFELAGSYQRAADMAAASNQPSGTIYAQAQAACASKADSVTQARCVSDYVSKHLLPATTPPPPPDHAKYTYDIHSPIWAPDTAGVAVLLTVICLAVAGWLKLMTPKSYF